MLLPGRNRPPAAAQPFAPESCWCSILCAYKPLPLLPSQPQSCRLQALPQAAAHPVFVSLISGISFCSSFQGIWVMSPAPSPLSSSAEQAPRCSMQPRARRACRTQQVLIGYRVRPVWVKGVKGHPPPPHTHTHAACCEAGQVPVPWRVGERR